MVDKILEVARYMDQNEGRLPLPDSVVVLPDYLAPSSSHDEVRKELSARQKARRLAEQIMLEAEQVRVSEKTLEDF